MSTTTEFPPAVSDLLRQLEAAVWAGDQATALRLEQALLKHLATEAQDRAALERQIRSLMESLRVAPRERPFSATTLRVSGEQGERVPYPVWFGTNRAPNLGGGFSPERGERTVHGRVDVFVPEAHRFGEIGTPLWKRLLRFDLRDDHLVIQHIASLARDAFLAEIRQSLDAVRDAGLASHALFFLHGFNVTFEEAAIRAAQIGVDLKVPGATAFFSWPSRGAVAAYPADEATIEASEAAITDFLTDFARSCGADKIHVIAHSMGNRGLLRALQRITATAEARNVRFGQIILAAPDVDRDLFLDLARLYPTYAERTTLYTSQADVPVHASAALHDAPRAGYFTPYTIVSGIDTVAVPDFDIDLLGHSYFAEAAALLHDIYDLMRNNTPPGQRQRLTEKADHGQSFWQLGA